ncbi:hypothetical protein L21SP2_2084 [Salinispira pacifica]|uniref:Uncharacterized protein n=1 Tax=Salinispira pacifica TaxID=1307761 RepID=V5WJU5_9SPIO|nr:hypothetical protein L21SP2_2084 [Salinispira pacifica]
MIRRCSFIFKNKIMVQHRKVSNFQSHLREGKYKEIKINSNLVKRPYRYRK